MSAGDVDRSMNHSASQQQQQESYQVNETLSVSTDGSISLTSNTAAIMDVIVNHNESPSMTLSLVSPSSSIKNSKSTTVIGHRSPRPSPLSKRRVRAHSFAGNLQQQQQQTGSMIQQTTGNDATTKGIRNRRSSLPTDLPRSQSDRQILLGDALAKAKCKDALRVNDSMVYLDGPQVYTCAQCRTHMTSHDDIISKSFHGRHGRAYLFDQCVNVTIGPSEDRRLITGMHTVSDIFCKRCKTLVGWTYLKAFESSQKYKEGKYIIEKINLHLEESDYYTVAPPAGERTDRWRQRSMSWGGSGGIGDENHYAYSSSTTSIPPSIPNSPSGERSTIVFEYQPSMP